MVPVEKNKITFLFCIYYFYFVFKLPGLLYSNRNSLQTKVGELARMYHVLTICVLGPLKLLKRKQGSIV